MPRLMPNVVEVFRRFPVAALSCVLLFLLNVYEERDIGGGYVKPDTFALVAAFLGSGAAHLFAESRKWSFWPSLVLAVLVGGVAGASQIRLPLLFVGLVLALFVAPFLGRGVKINSVGSFGLRLCMAAVVAIIVGVALMFGLWAILGGLNFVFSLYLEETAMNHVAALCIFLVGPLIGLSKVARAS